MSYIKLDRKIVDWEWFTDGNVLKLWIYILSNVNVKDKNWRGIEVPKGSMIASVNTLAEACEMSVRSVRTCLERLEKTGEISRKTTNKYTLINAIKWEEYQCSPSSDDKQTTNKRQTNDKQTTTPKEYKEVKNERNINNISQIVDCSPEFSEALKEFEKFRKLIKKPLTEEAKRRMLKKLKDLAPDEETQIKIIHQSIDHGWQGVFPLKERQYQNSQQKGLTSAIDSL